MLYLQGTFGKVYTAINNETGDIMAMKELPLQPNDHKTLRNVAEELRIFESIRHKHLINHYGVEVGRQNKMLVRATVRLREMPSFSYSNALLVPARARQ